MELSKHAIRFCRNKDEATINDLSMVAEAYLNQEELLDDTSSVPHIQFKRSQKYYDFFMVDALYRDDDGKLYWYITTDYELPCEDIRPLDFEDLPIWLIFSCLEHIDSMIKKTRLKNPK